jgi:hypothetical protein
MARLLLPSGNSWNPYGAPGIGGGGDLTGKLYLIAVSDSPKEVGVEGGR